MTSRNDRVSTFKVVSASKLEVGGPPRMWSTRRLPISEIQALYSDFRLSYNILRVAVQIGQINAIFEGNRWLLDLQSAHDFIVGNFTAQHVNIALIRDAVMRQGYTFDAQEARELTGILPTFLDAETACLALGLSRTTFIKRIGQKKILSLKTSRSKSGNVFVTRSYLEGMLTGETAEVPNNWRTAATQQLTEMLAGSPERILESRGQSLFGGLWSTVRLMVNQDRDVAGTTVQLADLRQTLREWMQNAIHYYGTTSKTILSISA